MPEHRPTLAALFRGSVFSAAHRAGGGGGAYSKLGPYTQDFRALWNVTKPLLDAWRTHWRLRIYFATYNVSRSIMDEIVALTGARAVYIANQSSSQFGTAAYGLRQMATQAATGWHAMGRDVCDAVMLLRTDLLYGVRMYELMARTARETAVAMRHDALYVLGLDLRSASGIAVDTWHLFSWRMTQQMMSLFGRSGCGTRITTINICPNPQPQPSNPN